MTATYGLEVRCPNCGLRNPSIEGECHDCGYTGLCRWCGEDTEFTDCVDLNYCSGECAQQAEDERNPW